MGMLSYHVYLAQTGDLERPDKMICDLDLPEGATNFDLVREAALDVRDVVLLLVRRREHRYTLEQRKHKRTGRIFMDVLRNPYGATAVAPYSVRAKPEATVATPLDWEEVEGGAAPGDWTWKNGPDRLAQRADPWSGLLHRPYALQNRHEKLDALPAKEQPAKEEKE